MIANPPHITLLLRTYARAQRVGLTACQLEFCLARLFTGLLGTQDWQAFQRTYQLYLQSIPYATARTAWGIASAATSHQKAS